MLDRRRRRGGPATADRSATSRRPCGPDGRQVRGGGERAERLVGADVAGRLLAADVLLARLQGEYVALAALPVAGRADQPAGHLPHRCHARRHEPDVRPAVRRAGCPAAVPRPPRCRRRSRRAPRAGPARSARPPRPAARRRACAASASSRHRLEPAEQVGLLRDEAGQLLVQRAAQPPRPGSGRSRPRPGRPAPPRSRCPARRSRWRARARTCGFTAVETATRWRRVRRHAISAASAVAVAPS